MSKFTINDMVRVKKDAPNSIRQGERAAVIMVWLPKDRHGSYYDQFPPGVVYSIEYEDGEAADVHEDFLESTD